MESSTAAALQPEFDVFLQGTVFFDIVLTGLETMPAKGTEVWASGMGSCPGGIANLAVAAARLGLRTTLAAAFGDDVYGDFCWQTLCEQEGVDLSGSRRFAGWHSPVTVSMSVARDRSMVTHAHEAPVSASQLLAGTPRARAGIVHVEGTDEASLTAGRGDGTLLFADVGWDPTERWDSSVLDRLEGCHAFLPNSVEAMAYTRTDDPRAALHRLAERVPLAVVTCGGQGALAVDATTGEEEWAPSLPVNAYDPTGAGDVFGAALVLGTLRGWPLRQRLAFANLCAALSVQQVGGSLAAPGWGDIADWWSHVQADAAGGSAAALEWRSRYDFLPAVLPAPPLRTGRRATATLARASDA
ncbi:sugar/nucleoside kinase (ribokinase family) [Motilibacter peucedani]|uniref:Sugar/nucleoside kinase (Ribokinase family) n=1 Tax=Motilibacter peucedani TaxID=598650 RepID=A0A420XKI3_9ACTN|nr:PfkB family carbohydrate kinase [Motilibacter peucedani]RKS68025.1 sugar/nucleoside kinase (ribokinase family) [Motilibacter peucedani]